MDQDKSVRQKLLDAIYQLGQLRPEWRLGQMLINAAASNLVHWSSAGDIWSLEDEEALKAVTMLIEQYEKVEGGEEHQKRLEALEELTQLSQSMGLYD